VDKLGTATAIITAAGSGSRLPGVLKKQFRELGGIPILVRSLEPFFSSPWIDNLIITAPEADLEYTQTLLAQYFEEPQKPVLVIPGGVERQDSVFGALQSCPEGTEYVAVHDGVRPFVPQELLDELFRLVQSEKAVIPAARIKHTVKQVEGDYAVATLPRQQLIQVFTPQVFAYDLLLNAYLEAYTHGWVGTDDASLLEQSGHQVRYLLSSEFNLKVTDEADLFFAAQLIEKNMI